MKIAFFLDTAHGVGGAGNVLLRQAMLMKNENEVIIVIPCDKDGVVNKEYKRRCIKANMKYVSMFYKISTTVQYIDILDAWRTSEMVEKFAIKEKITLFHSVQLNIGVEIASRKLGIPHLMNIYQLTEEELSIRCFDIFPRYHSCDSELFCTQWHNFFDMKTMCIRPSAPITQIKRKNHMRKNKLRFLMLGHVCPRKNQLTAIKAIEICIKNGNNIELTIAGIDTTEYASECKKYVQYRHLSDVVRFVGFQSDIEELLLDNDCYLCASIDESFPSSMVEAMSYDLTVVSTPVAGVPELMVDGYNSYISSGFEIGDIACIISKCFIDYENGNVNKIHINAEDTWKENFAQNIVRDQLEKYYRIVINEFPANRNYDNMLYAFDYIKNHIERIAQVNFQENIVHERYYYYAFLKKKLKGKSAYIWGAGNWGKIAYQLLQTLLPHIEVYAFIDQNKEGYYLGLPIIGIDEIKLSQIDYIFLGFAGEKDDVINYLQQKGLRYNDRIWRLP